MEPLIEDKLFDALARIAFNLEDWKKYFHDLDLAFDDNHWERNRYFESKGVTTHVRRSGKIIIETLHDTFHVNMDILFKYLIYDYNKRHNIGKVRV